MTVMITGSTGVPIVVPPATGLHTYPPCIVALRFARSPST